MVGGSGYFSSANAEQKSTNNTNINKYGGYDWSLQPNIGYFFTDKVVAGLSTSIGFVKSNVGVVSGTWLYGIGPYARYYLLNTDQTWNILTQISYYYSANSISDQKYTSFVVKAGPVIYFNNSVALELTGDFEKSNFKGELSQTIIDRFNIKLGLQIHLEK